MLIRSMIGLSESATFHLQHRMPSSFAAMTLKCYEHNYFRPNTQSPPC